MTTICEYCSHQFTNVLLRQTCPKCGQMLRRPADTYTSNNTQASRADDGFDVGGFAFGMATGVPLSPTHGVSVGSILGASMHSSPAPAAPAPDPAPSYSSPSPSYSSHESSSSYDSGSSSSSSDGGGGGGGGGGD